jgi:hypothetical protein
MDTYVFRTGRADGKSIMKLERMISMRKKMDKKPVVEKPKRKRGNITKTPGGEMPNFKMPIKPKTSKPKL